MSPEGDEEQDQAQAQAQPPAAGQRWRSLSPAQRAVISVLAGVVAVNVLLAGVQWVTGGAGPGGEPSSSYATAPQGAAAYADLLGRHGHPVRRLRSSLDRADLDPAATVVILDPQVLEEAEEEALERFVRDGGRLVAAGQRTAPTLRRLVRGGPVWSPGGLDRATTLAPAPEVAGVEVVRAAGEGVWTEVGSALPVLGGDEGILAGVATVGRGRVVLVADAAVVQNRHLGQADNAAFAVGAAGPSGRPVSFAEANHGYGETEGLAALPSRWRWALGLALVAVLVWMWSRAKRMGPAEEATRALPPPRRAYVDAMASTLARTRQPDAAIEPLRAATRARLARRAGLPADAPAADLVEATRRLGGEPEAMARLLAHGGAVGSDEELLSAGRAAAWARQTHP